MPPPEASYWPPALAWSYKAPKITQLYLSCLVAGVLKLTRSHGHQNYDPQLLGWSQGAHSLQASPRKENSRRDDVSEEAEDLGLQLNPGLQGPGDEGPENV